MPNHILNEGYENSSIAFEKGKGSKIYIKNKKYIDLSFAAGSLLLGHQSNIFKKSLKQIIDKKITTLSTPNNQAINFSKTLKKIFPQYSKFIFCNSGSEAVMKSIRISKAITKKNLIICVTGSWHGSNDKTLFSPNKNLMPKPISNGLSKYDKNNIKFIPYNDINLSKKILSKVKKKICCIIIEPVQASLPSINSYKYLKFLNEFTKKNKIILIFDEMITGLRTKCSSVQSIFKLTPDISTFGKCFGGGLPIGIIAIKENIKVKLDKNKLKVFFGGTFSGNSLSTYVGEQTVKYLLNNKKKIFENLNRKTNYFLKRLNELVKKNNIDISIFNFHSMFRIVFTKNKITNRIQRDFFEKEKFKKISFFKKYLFSNGIYYPSNGIIFLSTETTFQDLKKIIKTFKIAFLKYFKKK